ncbi:MAG TPA: YihY/virulence factor BrkB family protein [Candidatus Saccharimonadales bacterium]|nr:YihY/virulence factor BrkB family protein [Candidatus Saccharimonadales bacterium]
MDPGAILERFLDAPRVAYLRAVLDTYGRAPGGLLANGLAFAALFATVPIALVMLGVAGLLLDDPAVQAQLAEAIGDLFPPLRDLVAGALVALSDGAAVTSIVGIVALVWTVSQFYVTLDIAFSRIFTERLERDFVRRNARGFLSVAGLGGLILVLVVAGTLAAAAETLLPRTSAPIAAVTRLVTSLPVIAGLGAIFVLVVYRTVPPEAPTWRAAWLPAAVAGVSIVLLSQLFLFVAPRLVGAAAFAGSLASAFIALAWLSFTFQILLYGAAWVRVRDDRAAAARSALASPATPTEPGGGGE